jgi:hypothetical protein
MRSRLEARYAGLLDSQEVPWLYEPQVFASGDRQWLPDFKWLEFRNRYIEVKPTLGAAIEGIVTVEPIFASIPDAVVYIVWPEDAVHWSCIVRKQDHAYLVGEGRWTGYQS